MVLVAVQIVVSLLLVGLNAIFVATEFSIVRVRRTRLEELAGEGVPTARASILAVDRLDEFLSATQLGITLVSLGLGWVGETAFANLLIAVFPGFFARASPGVHAIAAALSFMTITLLHVVLGELVPKNLAIRNAEGIILRIARPMNAFFSISHPLINAFSGLAHLVLRAVGRGDVEEAPPLTEKELKLVMKESREEGVISEAEARIITRAFEFSDKRALDIMTPASRVDFLSLSLSVAENRARMLRTQHTRFPLCREGLESVIGIVHIKDLWPALARAATLEAFTNAMRPPLYVAPLTRQDQILRAFQWRHEHFAIVREPSSGETLGVVTIEDVLEELVGDIQDEHGH